MITKKEIPLLLLLFFTLIYSVIGDPNNEIWSGAYFIVNYLTQLMLFWNYSNKTVRLIGISLTISILLYVVLKYFTQTNITRYYTIVPFLISLIGLIKLEKKRWQN